VGALRLPQKKFFKKLKKTLDKTATVCYNKENKKER
jgi:hypothetical protein